jgi:hypothetical protein
VFVFEWSVTMAIGRLAVEGYMTESSGALSLGKKRYYKLDGCLLHYFKEKVSCKVKANKKRTEKRKQKKNLFLFFLFSHLSAFRAKNTPAASTFGKRKCRKTRRKRTSSNWRSPWARR